MEATARGLQLTVQPGEAGLSMHADRQIVSAVVVNLLQNAFKFTRPGTERDAHGHRQPGPRADLGRRRVRRSARRATSTICSARSSSAAPIAPGSGLGLAFSRWGAEVNDGRISARNLPDHGCVFMIELPRVTGLHEAHVH